jgi:MFS family permease
MLPQNEKNRMIVFIVIWFGQAVSLVGSGLTGFALGVWLFQQTGSITQFALIGLFTVLPRIILSPLVGPLVDRWDRRWAMILSDAGAGLSTLILVLLLYAGRLEIWHIYLLVAASAAFGTIQWPAFMAATTLLVPQENLGRANGLVQLGQATAEILAPAMAGVLLLTIQLQGIILIDVATFLIAVLSLLLVRFPSPKPAAADQSTGGSWRREISYGWHYITARPGLFGLLLFLTTVNFIWGMVGALITPMILGFTSSANLGFLISIAGGGMLAGSLAMTIWGGPRRRIHGVLNFELLSGACFLLMGVRPSFWPVALGVFGAHTTIAVIYGSNQAIWQTKVAPTVQGRVFATQQMLAKAAAPLAYLLAGPLAERIFEPLLTPTGLLSSSAGQVIGTGPGRGIALLFIVMGLLKIAVSLAAYLNPHIRLVEETLPDVLIDRTEPVSA